jgi:hypothetical protein
MDPTAHNYDSSANVNSNTWCVPRILGCMMPSPWALTNTNGYQVKDGGSGNFSAAATSHYQPDCTVGRFGCTVPVARNFDAKATIDDGTCYYNRYGCLDRSALNFNCSEADKYAVCSYAERALVPTIHDATICNLQYSPPRPPYPVYAADVALREVVSILFTSSGDVVDYDDARKASITGLFATTTGVDSSYIDLDVSAASVNVAVVIEPQPGTTPASVKSAVEGAMPSAEAASAFLAPAGIQVLSTPIIEQRFVPVIMPPAPPPPVEGANVGALIGGVVGGIVAVLIIVGIIYVIKKRKAKATYPA